MCWICIKHLRLSYNFRKTVLKAQEILKPKAVVLLQEDDIDEPLECKADEVDNFSSDEANVKEPIKSNCDYCGIQCKNQWELRRHLTKVHPDLRKFMCTYCGKAFKKSNHLKEHQTSHTGEKKYSCPICEKRFPRVASQKRHMRGHDRPLGHKTIRTPFLCTICGKNFPFSSGVQRHMRIHLGIKKFECNLCKRKFTQSTHLQVHMRTHTGEKPYICDICGQKFSLKACMLKHITNLHYDSKNLVDEISSMFYYTDNQ